MLKKLAKTNGPNPEAFSFPITEEEWKSMMKKMKDCGSDGVRAMSIRKNRFIEACNNHFNSNP